MILLVKSDIYNELSEKYIEKSSHRTERVRKLVQIHRKKGKDYQAYRWVKLQEESSRKKQSGSDKLEALLSKYAKNLSPNIRKWVHEQHSGCKKKYYKITEPETGHTYKGIIYEHPNRRHDENEFKERLQAVILASMGFKVYLIEEQSSGQKKVDALVNGVPVDFKKSDNQKDKKEDNSIQNNYQKGMKKFNCEGVLVHVVENKPTQVRLHNQKVHLPLDQAVESMTKDSKNGILSVWVETEQKFHSYDLKEIREAHKRTSLLMG